MSTPSGLTLDIFLETAQILVVTSLFLFLLLHGRKTQQTLFKGWRMIIAGFFLLMIASIMNFTDNFEQLTAFLKIGSFDLQTFFGNGLGYLGGYVLLFTGFFYWLPQAAEQEKTNTKKSLLESQKRYRDLVDLSPDAIVIHKKGKIIYANAAAADLVGAKSSAQMLGTSNLSYVHPAYQVLVRERMRALADGLDKVPLIEMKILTVDGQVVDAEAASGLTNLDGETIIISVLRDITDRLKAEQALRESERDLRSIFENMAEFYYRADLNGYIVRASGAAKEITGFEANELIGQKLASYYVVPEDRNTFLKALEEAGGRLRNFEAYVRSGNGERIWVSTNAQYYLDADGEIAGIEGTTRNITEMVKARELLQHMALHDTLTDLGNRQSFGSYLKGALPRARRGKVGGAVLYFDLDGFKPVNDAYGHDLGDKVLCEVAQRLTAMARETDHIARVGGDEFCIILENIDHRGAIAQVAEKLIAAISEPYYIQGHAINIGASVGIVCFTGQENPDQIHELLISADKAMYEAKRNGGNSYEFYDAIVPQGD